MKKLLCLLLLVGCASTPPTLEDQLQLARNFATGISRAAQIEEDPDLRHQMISVAEDIYLISDLLDTEQPTAASDLAGLLVERISRIQQDYPTFLEEYRAPLQVVLLALELAQGAAEK